MNPSIGLQMKNALGSVAVLLLLCSVPPPLIGKDCVALASRPCPVWAQLGRLPMRMRGGGRRTQLFSGEQAMPATATDRGSRRGRGRSLARSHSPSTEGLWGGEAPVEGDEFTQYGQKTAMGAVEIGAEGDEEAGQEGLGSERAGVAGSPTFLQDTESEQGAVGGEIRTMADVLDELGINANLRRREERELERQRAGGHAPEIAREMGLSDPSEDNPDGNHVAELVRFASQSDSGFTSWGGFSGLDMNRLYWGVRYFGTDFDVMQLALFPNRTRAELKRKYALERRRRPWLMDHALENPLEVPRVLTFACAHAHVHDPCIRTAYSCLFTLGSWCVGEPTRFLLDIDGRGRRGRSGSECRQKQGEGADRWTSDGRTGGGGGCIWHHRLGKRVGLVERHAEDAWCRRRPVQPAQCAATYPDRVRR